MSTEDWQREQDAQTLQRMSTEDLQREQDAQTLQPPMSSDDWQREQDAQKLDMSDSQVITPEMTATTYPGNPAVRGDVGDSNEDGVQGFTRSATHAGVYGENAGGAGVKGFSGDSDGVQGYAKNSGRSGVMGMNTGDGVGVLGQAEQTGAGVYARSKEGTGLVAKGGKRAGFFDGAVDINGSLTVTADITVSGDVRLVGADLAEQFSVVGDAAAEPGCVMVLAEDADCVRVSHKAYDKRVAGVVSGAGSYRPAIVLDRRDDHDRRPLALTGKVWCKVDASFGAVDIGDLLTTSPTLGHAMSATDPARAFGAVIGKALGSLSSGLGLVPVLVALH